MSLLPVHVLRRTAVRLFEAALGAGVTLFRNFEIRAARRLPIGARTSIGNGAILDARGGLTIGCDVTVSTDVHIWTGQHEWRAPDFAYVSAPVVVGDRAWVSTRVTILPGVTVGAGAVVAAGAVVTSDVPANTLASGKSAKPLGTRPSVASRLIPRRRKPWWW